MARKRNQLFDQGILSNQTRIKKKTNKKWARGCAYDFIFFFFIPNLKESGGEGDKESSGGPEESTEGDDVGAVVAHGQVGGDRVAR